MSPFQLFRGFLITVLLCQLRNAKKIQAIIDEHNYTPSVFARGMVNKQTKNIGVILPDISNPYFISLITQIQKFALDYMFSTILFNTMLAEPNNKNNQHPPNGRRLPKNHFRKASGWFTYFRWRNR